MNTKLLSAVLFLILLLTTFTCEDKLEVEPAVETGVVNTVATKNASIQGIIIDLGNGIDHHGHCFGLVPDPTVAGEKTNMVRQVAPTNIPVSLRTLLLVQPILFVPMLLQGIRLIMVKMSA